MEHELDHSNSSTGEHRSCSPAIWNRPIWRDTMTFAEPAAVLSEDDLIISESEEILFSLAVAVEQRDRHTALHCERLAWIGVAMGVAMGMSRASLSALYRGGYLHDVGKVGIPDCILFKPDRLTADEWVVMRSHAPRGEEICRPMK